ncbi:MAG: pyridoxine 5'-phosphate synthase [Gammaproteobacteria bacterium WSBS_2016_MAG_OTU1]
MTLKHQQAVQLGVNIDHIAVMRQARYTPYPDLVRAAQLAEDGGGDFITIHLREDRRHIVDADLPLLKNNIKTFLNLEIAATAEMQQIALALSPPKICLVPERRAELTTEGGLDAHKNLSLLRDFCAPFIAADIEVSLFLDPVSKQIDAAAAIGVAAVELHTGEYAADGNHLPLQNAASHAAAANLRVHAGHGLHLQNVAAIANIPHIVELNIGHAIVARAVFVGLKQAVSEMATLLKNSPTTESN